MEKSEHDPQKSQNVKMKERKKKERKNIIKEKVGKCEIDLAKNKTKKIKKMRIGEVEEQK